VHFSPDGRSVIFRANFEGHTDIYAVEIEKPGPHESPQNVSTAVMDR
jgi:hypothetical protein